MDPVISVWQQTTPALEAELVTFWREHGAIMDAAIAARRAPQAVAIARDDDGAIWGVGTAALRTLPRLRQPMYYYRQFFAENFRGRGEALPFARAAKGILESYNASLPTPESLGVLIELANPELERRRREAQDADSVFIGYSPRGHQLRVAYFTNARLLPPAPLPRVAGRSAA